MQAEGVLLAGHRHQQHAASLLVRLCVGREDRTDRVQHLLEATEAHRHLGEVAGIDLPQFAEPPRGRRQEIEVEGLDRGTARLHPRDEIARHANVAGQNQTGELFDVTGGRLDGCRLTHRLARRATGKHQPGDDVGVDAVYQLIPAAVRGAKPPRLPSPDLTRA